MSGSAAFAGAIDHEHALSRVDREGKMVSKELERIGYAGKQRSGDHPIDAYFEAHIEQGPILEDEDKTIGVVTAVQGIAWYDITVTGQDSHAGSTPMHTRRDALLGSARMIDTVNKVGLLRRDGRATVGELGVSPNSRNTIPGES